MIKLLYNLSPDGGEGGGSEITFTPEQEAVIQQRLNAELEKRPQIDLKTAQDFLKNAGIQTFASKGDYHNDIASTLSRITSEHIENPNELEKTILKFKSSLAGEVLSPVDQVIKTLTGKEKQEGEKTRDYLNRVLPEVMKNGASGVDPSEFNGVKSKLAEALNENQKLQKQYQELNNKIKESTTNQLMMKGLPSNLDYSTDELNMLLPGIKSNFFAKFELKENDNNQTVLLNKETNEMVLTKEGHPESLDKVFGEYVKSLTHLRFSQDKGEGKNGASLPGSTGNGNNGNLNAEQTAELTKQWEQKLVENGLIGHELKAHVMRKEMGLPISKQALERWPELKS